MKLQWVGLVIGNEISLQNASMQVNVVEVLQSSLYTWGRISVGSPYQRLSCRKQAAYYWCLLHLLAPCAELSQLNRARTRSKLMVVHLMRLLLMWTETALSATRADGKDEFVPSLFLSAQAFTNHCKCRNASFSGCKRYMWCGGEYGFSTTQVLPFRTLQQAV